MNEYLIKKETITATADAIRANLPIEQLVIREDLIADGNMFIDNAVTIAYYEYIDYTNSYNDQEAHSTDGFIGFGYLPNNEGITVPVIFKTDLGAAEYDEEFVSPDYEDKFYYVGNVTVDGITYNKWRKIEAVLDGGFAWTSEYQQYVYTNEIVESVIAPSSEQIDPADFPSKVHEVHEAGYNKGFDEAKTEYGGLFESLIDRSITTLDLTKFENLSTIGAYAFCQCTNLTRVILPYVETIGEYAFYNCPNLKTVLYKITPREWDERITIGEGNEQLIDNVYFYCENREDFIDGYWYWHYVDGIPTVWEGQASRGLEYTLLDDNTYSVTGIGACTDTDVVLPKVYNGVLVTSVGDAAFASCKSLTSITIPDSVTRIMYRAFVFCTNLTSITIPDSVISIGVAAFSTCTSLTSITIPNSVTSIGDAAFYECTSLESIVIPNSVTSIGYGAFENCSALAIVYYSGTRYHDGSPDWDNITIASGNEALKNAARIYGTEITEDYYVYTISNDWSSYGCVGVSDLYSVEYLNTINIADTIAGFPVTWIGDNAFMGYSAEFINIGDNIRYIGDGAFYNCSPTAGYVTIPASVIDIGYDAFYDFVCNGGEFIYEGNAIQWKSVAIHDEATALAPVKFLAPLPTYTDEQGITYTSSSDNTYYVCSSAAEVSEPNITIVDYISGIPVKEIGEYAFFGTPTHSIVETITIPDTVKIIGEAAFANGSSAEGSGDPTESTSTLYHIEIPNSVTTIGNYAFAYCVSLQSIDIPDSVTHIGDGAFECCIRVDNLDLGNGVETIGYRAFSPLGTMAEFSEPFVIHIPDSVTSIGDGAFDGSAISEVIFGANSRLDTINDSAFYYCSQLYYVSLPISLISIGDSAFGYCENLTDITIPSCVASINSYAFSGNSTTIYVPWSEGEVANAPWGTTGEVIYNYSE